VCVFLCCGVFFCGGGGGGGAKASRGDEIAQSV